MQPATFTLLILILLTGCSRPADGRGSLFGDLDKLAAAMPPTPATQTKESALIATRFFPVGQSASSAEQLLKASGFVVARHTDQNSRNFCGCDALLTGSVVRRSRFMWSQTYWIILDLKNERVSGGRAKIVNSAP